MKNIIKLLFITYLLISCFEEHDITPPHFIEKYSPDSLEERGIDAHPNNAIFLEWEEPSSAESEGILDYYIYRGKLIEHEYKFKRIASVKRKENISFDSNKYVDYDINLDTTYYYFLKSHNDFSVSRETSDTVCYKLSQKAILNYPFGDIYDNQPRFEFRYPKFTHDNINYFYFRLAYFENTSYTIKFFLTISKFDLSQTIFWVYINSINSQRTILYDDLWQNSYNEQYLEKGNYRWRVDAISRQPSGTPEIEGSESDWMYFTVK